MSRLATLLTAAALVVTSAGLAACGDSADTTPLASTPAAQAASGDAVPTSPTRPKCADLDPARPDYEATWDELKCDRERKALCKGVKASSAEYEAYRCSAKQQRIYAKRAAKRRRAEAKQRAAVKRAEKEMRASIKRSEQQRSSGSMTPPPANGTPSPSGSSLPEPTGEGSPAAQPAPPEQEAPKSPAPSPDAPTAPSEPSTAPAPVPVPGDAPAGTPKKP